MSFHQNKGALNNTETTQQTYSRCLQTPFRQGLLVATEFSTSSVIVFISEGQRSLTCDYDACFREGREIRHALANSIPIA